jgi:hypothetical protein
MELRQVNEVELKIIAQTKKRGINKKVMGKLHSQNTS